MQLRRHTPMVTALVALAIGAPTTAWAEVAVHSTAVVSVAGAQATRDVADQRAAVLVEALGDPAPTTVEESRAALLRALGRNEPQRVAGMARRADEALAAFDDLETTARLLRRAADAHLDILPLLDSIEAPVRLLVGLATVEIALGRENEVHRALVAAHRLDPELDLDPQEVSPRLVRALRRAREDASEQPLLAAEQARTLARRLGVERLLIVQPRPGARRTLVEHYLASSGARLRPWLVRGAELAPIAVLIRPRPVDLAPVGPPGGSEPSPSGDPSGPVQVAAAGDGDPERLPVFGGSDDPDGLGDVGARRPVYRRWWFWTLIGVVVAGGAAAGVVLGLGVGQPDGDLPLEVRGHW